MISRLRVPAGYAVGALVILLARPQGRLLVAGAVLAVGGEALRLWASGHIDKTERLATGGPYAHTRNPLYLGSLLMGLGLAVAAASALSAAAVAAYFLAFYPRVMSEEAAFLRSRFPAEYDRWTHDVPPFFPRLRGAGPRATRFAWERVRHNREWQAVAALPVVIGLLWARGAWLG